MKSLLAPLLALATLAIAPVAQASKPTERRLHSDQVESSSFLWNDWNKFQENYHPNYVADDDPVTAWTEGAASSGAGEWLRIRLTELDGTSRVRLKIRNGYQKSPKLFAANARAKGVTVKLLPSGITRKAVLTDQQGWQELTIDQPAGKLEAIELAAVSVYEGTKYTDLCISDIEVFATSTTRENPTFEKAKLDKLLTWKKERIETAKVFRDVKATALPIHPAYRVDERAGAEIDVYGPCAPKDWDDPKARATNALCQTRIALETAIKDPEFGQRWKALLPSALAATTGASGFAPARIAPVDKRPIPTVDGLAVPDLYNGFEAGYGYGGFELPLYGTLASLRAEDLRALSTTGKLAMTDVMINKAPGCRTRKGRIYEWVQRTKLASEGSAREIVRGVVAIQCGNIEVRDGTSNTAQLQVLIYGDDGNLALVAGPGYVVGYEWTQDAGRAVLAGGRRLALMQGRHDILRIGNAAKATP